MSFDIIISTKGPKAWRSLSFWLSIVSALIIAGVFFLAYSSTHEGAVELQTAPWKTLLFIDNTTENL